MSDLAATNCGCGCDNGNGGCSSLIWIILLLSCCGNNGIGGCGNCGDNICWIILLLLFCNGGNGCGPIANNNCGCGC